RFDKHAEFVRDRIRQSYQVAFGKCQKFSECAVASHNPQNGAIWAMTSDVGYAEIATSARGVDLTNDPLAGRSAGCAVNNFPAKLVAGNSPMRHVAPRQFKIRPADSSHSDADQTFARRRKWIRIIVAEYRARIKNKCAHVSFLSACRPSFLQCGRIHPA